MAMSLLFAVQQMTFSLIDLLPLLQEIFIATVAIVMIVHTQELMSAVEWAPAIPHPTPTASTTEWARVER